MNLLVILDAANEQNIIELLKRINEELGITIITVTHSDKVANSMQSICTVVDGETIRKEMIK